MRKIAAARTRSNKKAEITKSRQTAAGKPDLTTSAAASAAASAASKTTCLIYLSPVKTSVSEEGVVDIPTLQFGTNFLWIMIIYLTR